MPGQFGTALTQDERFIDFEIDADGKVYEWMDVTGKQNVNEHNRGTGRGDGAIALTLLRELNAESL